MTTICVNVNMGRFDTVLALAMIANSFPCFVDSLPVGYAGEAEISIQCRQEDAASIEKILSPYV